MPGYRLGPPERGPWVTVVCRELSSRGVRLASPPAQMKLPPGATKNKSREGVWRKRGGLTSSFQRAISLPVV